MGERLQSQSTIYAEADGRNRNIWRKTCNEKRNSSIAPYTYRLVEAATDKRPLFRMHVDGEHGPLMPVQALQDVLGHDIPQDDMAVLAPRRDECLLAVLVTVHAKGGDEMKLCIDMTLVRLDAFAIDVVPHAQGRVEHTGEDVPAVWGEAHAADGRRILVEEGTQALAAGGVPHANEAVRAAAGDEGAVAAKVDAADGIRVRGQRAQRAARARVPQHDSLVERARGEHVAARRKGDAVHGVRVPEQRARVRGARGRVPQPDRLVVGAGRQRRRVGRPGERADAREVAAERVHVRAGAGVPDLARRVGGWRRLFMD